MAFCTTCVKITTSPAFAAISVTACSCFSINDRLEGSGSSLLCEPGTSNCKINGHFSIQNHHSPGAILHCFCIFNRKIGKSWHLDCNSQYNRKASSAQRFIRKEELADDETGVDATGLEHVPQIATMNGHFSIRNHRFSGAIRKKMAFMLQFATAPRSRSGRPRRRAASVQRSPFYGGRGSARGLTDSPYPRSC